MADLTTLLGKFLDDLYAGTMTISGALTAQSGTFSGTVTVGANAALAFNGRAMSQSPANGQWNITNNAATAGVGLDVSTDGTLKVRNRAQNADAILTASAFQTMTALVALGGGAAPTVGTIGGSGPATAAQNTWLRMLDSTGTAFWVPAWK